MEEDGLDFTGAYDMLTWVISELYKRHLYLLDSDKIDNTDKDIAKQLVRGNASLKDTKGSLILETLMAGGCIVQRADENLTYDYLHSSEDNLWSMLYLTGYLTKAREDDYEDELPDGTDRLEFIYRKSYNRESRQTASLAWRVKQWHLEK